jgi:hypothetical protein
MKWTVWPAGLITLALLGCDGLGSGGKDDSGRAGAKCSSDGDCKNGFLCEAKTCVPESVARQARGNQSGDEAATGEAPGSKKPTGAVATAAAAPQGCGDPSRVPEIPSSRSDPPTGAEWEAACAVNTQGANAQPSHCNMRIVREWLSVTCRGSVMGYEKMEDFGSEGRDYFRQFALGEMGSFVVRLAKGHNQKVRICRRDDRASLFVSWPPSNERPLHVALGRGPACDGLDWGSGYKK